MNEFVTADFNEENEVRQRRYVQVALGAGVNTFDSASSIPQVRATKLFLVRRQPALTGRPDTQELN